ncbi:uncharacterized protein Stacl isoform X2 [Hetaerina americana]|uniref:uncharacterized protein Stacl isoform X2 n=1 Tax=Hetaerina americana TaxID=62018 RepID=UPI003A7F45C3
MYVIFPAEELVAVSEGASEAGRLAEALWRRGMAGELSLRDLAHPALNEALKAHSAVAFKLVRTVSDFTQQLSQVYEAHAEELQRLVEGFRKRNAELRKERPACQSTVFTAWETLLAEVEVDSQAHSDIASVLGRQVARPLLEKTFHRKIQARKVFTHRESFETILSKTEEVLQKCRQDYKAAYAACAASPTAASLSAYVEAHNAYVQQLGATNGMIEEYGKETLPQLLRELEDVYSDLCSMLSEAVVQGAEIISSRATEQGRRYESLSAQCRSVAGPPDLANFARSVPVMPHHHHPLPRPKAFAPPQPSTGQSSSPPSPGGGTNLDMGGFDNDANSLGVMGSGNDSLVLPPPLKNEIVLERSGSSAVAPLRSRYDALKKDASELETQIKQAADALDTLIRMQQRSLEASLFNKANELQEDISLKRFDLRVAQIHLAAVRAQKELFASKVESSGGGAADGSGRERKMSSTSTGSMRSKWLKAFKSLKTPPSSTSGSGGGANAAPTIRESERKNNGAGMGGGGAGADLPPGIHQFQEYTYKKITPCDICSQVLRGHTRQGLKCRVCKLNVHVDCQEKAMGAKCQAKSRLLRRQKSTSEIETVAAGHQHHRGDAGGGEEEKPQEVDLIYQVLKQAGEISGRRLPAPNASSANASAAASSASSSSSSALAPGGGGEVASTSASSLLRRNLSRGVVGTSGAGPSSLSVGPAPNASCSEAEVTQSEASSSTSSSRRRRIFAGMRSLSVFQQSSAGAGSGSNSPKTAPGSPLRRGFFHSGGSATPQNTQRQRTSSRRSHARSISLPETGNHIGMRTSSSSVTLSRYQDDALQPGLLTVPNHGHAPNVTAPHSPRRQKLNLRMKSLSLDSPESTEHVQRQRRHAAADHQTSSQSSSSRIQSPSSPVHNRRLLSARNMRMSSVELPDENEKSLSSASTSPCPSPKPHRLLPTNLYVVLYNFKSRHPDELDLKAGYKVTVIDTSDQDWWQGKCLGRVGYFPSKYVTRLQPGERPLQVTHNLQVSDGDNGLMLLRDQIVIQVGEELDGMVMIRSGDNRQGVCPLKFLQEV